MYMYILHMYVHTYVCMYVCTYHAYEYMYIYMCVIHLCMYKRTYLLSTNWWKRIQPCVHDAIVCHLTCLFVVRTNWVAPSSNYYGGSNWWWSVVGSSRIRRPQNLIERRNWQLLSLVPKQSKFLPAGSWSCACRRSCRCWGWQRAIQLSRGARGLVPRNFRDAVAKPLRTWELRAPETHSLTEVKESQSSKD